MTISHKEDICSLTCRILNVQVGYLTYSLIDSQVYINFIFVEPTCRRQGIAKSLIRHLTSMYDYDIIHPGMTTELGQSLLDSMDKEFEYYRDKIGSKHLPYSVIEALRTCCRGVATLVNNIYVFGYAEGYKKTLQSIHYAELEYMSPVPISEVTDIADWIVGSATNNHDITDPIPTWVISTLHKLGVDTNFLIA